LKKAQSSQKEKRQVTAFRKAARELGADESPERFDAALKTVGRHKPKDKDKPPVLRAVRPRQKKAP
jgi:hypothetical protein